VGHAADPSVRCPLFCATCFSFSFLSPSFYSTQLISPIVSLSPSAQRKKSRKETRKRREEKGTKRQEKKSVTFWIDRLAVLLVLVQEVEDQLDREDPKLKK
jgi:hypothetical protein